MWPKTIKQRSREVVGWLRRTFPTPAPVILRVVESVPEKYGECLGICVWADDWKSSTLWVRETTMSETLSTVFHEYCHAITGGEGECGGHDDTFYLKLGEIERAWFYEGGEDASKVHA
jgi:hypothetical protein